MADLFKALKPTKHPSKNGFDLSRKHVFSSKVGQALPCLAVETVPNDHIEIDLTSLTRTQTFDTAAFLRGKMRYDFFFVPYSQLWHPFNQFVTQRTDRHSTRQLNHNYCPVVELSDLLNHLFLEHQAFLSGNHITDMHGFDYASGMIRVLDLLGYGNFSWILETQGESSLDDFNEVKGRYEGKYVNIFRLAAYQHIWYDYYRNKYYDVQETGGLSASNPDLSFLDYIYGFNFDDVNCLDFGTSIAIGTSELNSSYQFNNDGVRWRNLLKLNYIQWKKDLFTSALPGQQFGVVSSVDISGASIFNDYVRTSSVSSTGTVQVLGTSGNGALTRAGDIQSNSWSIPSAFDVLSLRKAEALQSWKQATLRAGNMTDDAFEAHYGTKPYYDSDENVNYLGSISNSLQVNAVESTSDNGGQGNQPLGSLAATGTIVGQGNKIKFDARDFGVIMCICSYLPESEYESNCLDKANTLYEQFDFFTDEFQNIGLEAVPQYLQDSFDPADWNIIIGFAPRYFMYKTAVDKTYGAFNRESQDYMGNFYKSGVFQHWVSPRHEYRIGTFRNLRTFYVDPHVYDQVFGLSADSTYATDHFLNNVFFDIKAIRPMSVLGLPEF